MLPNFRQGMDLNELSASELQALTDGVRGFLNMKAGPGIKITRTHNNVIISALMRGEIPSQEVAGGVGTRFRLALVDYDHMTAIKYLPDGSLESTATIIAKPWRLQRRTHLGTVAGVTYTWQSPVQRTCAKGTATEIQVVTEPWRATEDIIAIEVENGVGFSVNNEPVVWYDLNAGAHAWAAKNPAGV